MPKSLSTFELWAKLADTGLVGFSRGNVACEGDYVRLGLLPKDSTGLSKAVVSQNFSLSSKYRVWMCVRQY